MRVVHLSRSASLGGAARAAYRIHGALRAQGVDSQFLTKHNPNNFEDVIGPTGKKANRAHLRRVKQVNRVLNVIAGSSADYRSLGILPSNVAQDVVQLKPDITHLHWVNGEMMSIADIGRIKGPALWTLHDMWAFGGARHTYRDAGWVHGFSTQGAEGLTRASKLDRWVWRRKKRNWVRPFHILTPSRWLAKCVRDSELMQGWPVEVCPNPLDVSVWTAQNKRAARQALGLDPDARYVLFGAMAAENDKNKGFDLLLDALSQLPDNRNTKALVFGNLGPLPDSIHSIPAHGFGVVSDDARLATIYSAGDVMVVPSRIDNLPQTATEALACGTPVAAFDTCGLPDIVLHGETGLLAPAFDTAALARAIDTLADEGWNHVRSDAGQNGRLSERSHICRDFAVAQYHPEHIAKKHIEIYGRVLDAASGAI